VLYNGEGGFEGKLRALIAAVSRLVGLPATGRKARKFLLRPGYRLSKEELAQGGVECKTFTIEKCYPLLPGNGASAAGSEEAGYTKGGYTYVRRRSSEEGFASYGETRVEVSPNPNPNLSSGPNPNPNPTRSPSYNLDPHQVKDGETIELKRVLKASEYARMV
tara:strand:- start:252 stop:740 length:489 start_codon:yes stop_codon:yes gene_type:complete